jgi:hypothetical protein
VLTLAPGGTYACVPAPACAPIGAGGRWERYGDFEVAFHGADGIARLERVVTFRGELRLTAMDDIDSWPRELTFRHRAPASQRIVEADEGAHRSSRIQSSSPAPSQLNSRVR